MTDLTISIVAYRSYEDITDAIESIEHYTSPALNKRIIVIDNSAPFSEEILRKRDEFLKLMSPFPDVTYIDAGGNLGFGKGHNQALDRLDSKYHAIVNPDILLCDDAFSSILAYLDREPEVGMVIPRMIDADGETQLVCRRELTVFDMFVRMFCGRHFKKRQAWHTMQDMDWSKPFQVPFGQGSFLVIRTELFKRLGGFDERYFMYIEDADLCRRVNETSRLMYFPGATVIHKWEKGSHKNKTLFKYHLQSMLRYFNKWGWKFL